MNILVIGSGGREHALVSKLSQSKRVAKIFCAPGNAGIEKEAECVPIAADDIKTLLSFAKREKIDLMIVGPEVPLAMGIVNIFCREGLKIFGPTKEAALIESSKSFAKEFCLRHKIPTAKAVVFSGPVAAKEYLTNQAFPIVIKADGLAAGKGVFICQNVKESLEAVSKIAEITGGSESKIIVEEYLDGEEASFIVITDGRNILPLASSQDHKRVFDGDRGLNTGGMGAYSPAPVITPRLHDEVMEKIIHPAVRGMKTEGTPFVGALYAGLMICNGAPYLLEFNCRFGDPETQAIMPRLTSDLLDVIQAAVDGELQGMSMSWEKRASVCVVMASKGYPSDYEKGKVIAGIDSAAALPDVKIFHAATKRREDDYITDGGRVLGVTALGKDIDSAVKNAYTAVEKISWNGVHYRKDIGKRGCGK